MTGTVTTVPVVSIRLERAEGPIPLPEPVTVTGPDPWEQANRQLRQWQHTAPRRGGGYDKTDFTVTFADGETYEGRFDLEAGEAVDLAGHVNGFLDWAASRGSLAPDLPTPAEIAAWRATYPIGDQR